MIRILFACYCIVCFHCSDQFVYAQHTRPIPDWSDSAKIPKAGDRKNIFEFGEDEWAVAINRGRIHATWYPYQQTGMLIPIDEFEAQLKKPKFGCPFHSVNDLYEWMNLPRYSKADEQFPIPPQAKQGDYIGVTQIERGGWQGVTFSCTACHADRLFGKPVFGLANRFGRGSDFFYFGKMLGRFSELSGIELEKKEGGALDSQSRKMQFVGVKMPSAPGLVTSLAQTSVSLTLRDQDDVASMGKPRLNQATENRFHQFSAASKPPALWLAKYKTRWLNDGSQVSGNPVHVNFVWNELGRAGDMSDLEDWFGKNKQTVDEITAAVFASEPPHITDFFSADAIDLNQATKGQILFDEHFARCHGRYEKGWESINTNELTLKQKLMTTQVRYPRKTRVVDVGTDPNRYLGMQTLAPQLNRLRVSTKFGVSYQPQKGYVPQPLVGIWARWPYFHNNSVPTLRDVLTRSDRRPEVYYAGKAIDTEKDYDFERAGYPIGESAPISWRSDPRNKFDTSRAGLSNQGHDKGIFLKDGQELLTDQEKDQIVEFLKTL